ncbi:BRO1-like domain-containing protein [Scheffersomyces coipomensis]|uniref:BRO1-like domain-containing protein n=1 Tax=Scheffersomyces coipomensis TaxID=1788519 RepID=UPI00315C7932
MNTNLLYIPFRQSKPINLGDELREVIKSDYFQPPSTFETDLLLVNNLRSKISNLKNETLLLESEALLKEYFICLQSIRKKFPDDCVEFGWYSTLTSFPGGPTKSRSLKIEQLNIVFQLGSTYSQLALLESRHTDEGLKNACAYFQLAAGCFDYIISAVKLENEDHISSSSKIHIPSDLQFHTLDCLKQLMLAQAQETIWQKAIGNPSIKDSVIARLSIQASEYYSLALENANTSDFIKIEWTNHIAIKKFHFKAAANFRMATLSQDTFEYGEQIAYLRVAAETCAMAKNYKRYVNNFVIEDFEGLTDTIQNTLRISEKENDLVYLKLVPNAKDLKPLIGTSMIKLTIPEFLLNPDVKSSTIFKALLPHVIIQVAQAFHERRENYIREKFIDPTQALNNILVKFLADRGLPASIDSIQQPENLPKSIIQHSQEIVSLGGTRIIEQSIQEISELSKESRRLIDECSGRLQLEANEDEMLRRKFGTQNWNKPSTHEATKDLIEKITKMSNYQEQAKSGDNLVALKYQELKPFLEIYCGGYESLIDFIPNSSYVALEGDISIIISDLRDALNQVIKMEEKRKEFLSGLEMKVRDHNILPLALEEYKANQDKMYDDNGNINPRAFEPVYERHLKIFNDDLKVLESSKKDQIKLENEIDTLNNRFISEFNSENNQSQTKRKEVLQTLETVYAKYLEVISNLNEGSKFYSDFIAKGNGVLKECDDFLYHRRLEARDLELEINNRMRNPHLNQVRLENELTTTTSQTNSEIGELREIEPEVQETSQKPRLYAPGAKGVWNPNHGIKFD